MTLEEIREMKDTEEQYNAFCEYMFGKDF